MDRNAESDANGNFGSFHKSETSGNPADEERHPPSPVPDAYRGRRQVHVTGTLRGFRDGLGLAMQLADDYAFIGAGVLLDGAGNIVDLVTSEGIGRPVGPLVGRICTVLDRPKAPPDQPFDSGQVATPAVVLLSVRPFDADVIREADLALYRRARWAIGVAGAELLDWIETDGDLFRSYAYVTCPALAWPDDPPGERLDRAWSA